MAGSWGAGVEKAMKPTPCPSSMGSIEEPAQVSMSPADSLRVWARPLLLVAVVALGSWLVLRFAGFSPAELAHGLDFVGPWGPVLLVGLYVAAGLFFFPITVLGIAAGLLFGPVWGTVYVLIAVNVAAFVGFIVARFGRGPLIDVLEKKAQGTMGFLQSHGVLTILGARMLPFLPFSVLNYASAFSSIRMKDYLLGTLIGVVPLTVVYVMIGATMGSITQDEAFSARVVALFAAAAFLGIAVTWMGFRLVGQARSRHGRGPV
jgi:uncharacterized membrane protein YdjX (TVP38/TMEM64 family)